MGVSRSPSTAIFSVNRSLCTVVCLSTAYNYPDTRALPPAVENCCLLLCASQLFRVPAGEGDWLRQLHGGTAVGRAAKVRSRRIDRTLVCTEVHSTWIDRICMLQKCAPHSLLVASFFDTAQLGPEVLDRILHLVVHFLLQAECVTGWQGSLFSPIAVKPKTFWTVVPVAPEV
jgi:hypothetical protein